MVSSLAGTRHLANSRAERRAATAPAYRRRPAWTNFGAGVTFGPAGFARAASGLAIAPLALGDLLAVHRESRGALMPMRTCEPLTAMTVTSISSPIRSASPARRVRINMNASCAWSKMAHGHSATSGAATKGNSVRSACRTEDDSRLAPRPDFRRPSTGIGVRSGAGRPARRRPKSLTVAS